MAIVVLRWKVPGVPTAAILEPFREVEGSEGDEEQQ